MLLIHLVLNLLGNVVHEIVEFGTFEFHALFTQDVCDALARVITFLGGKKNAEAISLIREIGFAELKVRISAAGHISKP